MSKHIGTIIGSILGLLAGISLTTAGICYSPFIRSCILSAKERTTPVVGFLDSRPIQDRILTEWEAQTLLELCLAARGEVPAFVGPDGAPTRTGRTIHDARVKLTPPNTVSGIRRYTQECWDTGKLMQSNRIRCGKHDYGFCYPHPIQIAFDRALVLVYDDTVSKVKEWPTPINRAQDVCICHCPPNKRHIH